MIRNQKTFSYLKAEELVPVEWDWLRRIDHNCGVKFWSKSKEKWVKIELSTHIKGEETTLTQRL